jgi:hypothetical protein
MTQMDTPMDRVEEPVESVDRLGNIERRDFLTKAAAAGAIAWATPVILSRPAFAQVGSPVACETISISCTTFECDGPPSGTFPGIEISVSCTCGTLVNPWCVMFNQTVPMDPNDIRAFRVLGTCAGAELAYGTSYCVPTGASQSFLIGHAAAPNDSFSFPFSIDVSVNVSCGSEDTCQAFTITWDAVDDCGLSTPAVDRCAALTDCTGCS